MSLMNKVDFAIIIGVENANPNGDPLNGNRPRQTYDRLGEISDVCIKRKIRNRLLRMGEPIFVQSDDNRIDECRSLNERFNAAGLSDNSEKLRQEGCQKWFDVRAFGQVFAFPGTGKKSKKQSKKDTESGEDKNPVSIGIRGPVTVQSAYSLGPVMPESIQITKSVNLETTSDPEAKGSDTMGMKHRIGKATYVAYGAISPQLAQLTGFDENDAEKLKLAIRSLFEGDASSARPEGSMEVIKVVWWSHDFPCGNYSSAKVHRALKNALASSTDGSFDENAVREALPGLNVQFLDQLEGKELAELLNK
jgi:CRISPR-associated protein Csd2